MRILTCVHDHAELSRIVGLMHEKGIPTFTRDASPRRGPPHWIVFVCLNSQAEDAVRILKDPDLIAARPVNVDTFERAAYTRNMDVAGQMGFRRPDRRRTVLRVRIRVGHQNPPRKLITRNPWKSA
ncbi:hypothetical protein M2650_01080 [Luteimonas sp. SX5]|uniref:DUF2007 domain-containing protein n=1 Tax=Luteimonas galliterrae TaxID=2940486 RepID=A0ABT0MEE9_9GAMM|nr:hypothetical protein [Luteimonas galliterrae]MCL1633243.1 hypothetical protein [Luteimonas galliterrae]